MARPLRIEVAGGRHHITARGNERRDIFRDNRDRERFIEVLAELPTRFGTVLHGFALMSNHYHLVLETPEPNLSRAGQWLNVSYGVWFNRRHGRSGHLFQGRFKSHLIEDEAGLMEVVRYVHLNPVRIGRLGLGKAEQARQRTHAATRTDPEVIRQRLRALRDFRWSSHAAYVGWAKAPAWLNSETVLGLCSGESVAKRRQEFRRYVEEPIREGVLESPWERLIGGAILGSEAFVEGIRDRIKGDRREQKETRALAQRNRWEEIVSAVEVAKGEKWEVFRDRHGDWGRDAVLYFGRRWGRMRLTELASRVGDMEYAAVGTALSRFRSRMQGREIAGVIAKIEARLSRSGG